uniref:Uncharacterized protein n=1 Tax=Oryza punctata TaxID=4537 RepID=A0A0E0LKE0_ORYPU
MAGEGVHGCGRRRKAREKGGACKEDEESEAARQIRNAGASCSTTWSTAYGSTFFSILFVPVDQLVEPMEMASIRAALSGLKNSSITSMGAEKLPDQMHDLKIRDDKEVQVTNINGKGTKTGHIIVTTTGGRNDQPKQIVSYMAERIVGQGLFGIVFQQIVDTL